MRPTAIITTEEAQAGFFPTPPEMVDRLLAGIDWARTMSILEPSAGKGDIVDRIATTFQTQAPRYRDGAVSVDCIELDPHLRSILKYEFCGQKEDEFRSRLSELRQREEQYDQTTRRYRGLSDAERVEKNAILRELERRKKVDVHIIHDNFLTFDSRKHYDLIIMNPPFSNGDAHLLHAIELQAQHGGQIRCILNAETILNPYTNRRKVLQQKLDEYGATVSFVDNGFSHGERRTDVQVAVVEIQIPEAVRESEIYERLRKAAEEEEAPQEDVTDLVAADFLSQIVTRYNVEVDAGIALIQEYRAMEPYILSSLDTNETYNAPNLVLNITNGASHNYATVNRFIELTRKKYWTALFTNREFMGRLTTNLRDKYRKMVDKMTAYDFSLFNIQQVMTEMNAEMAQGLQDTIVALFDKLTTAHSWYPEIEKTIHYYSGWATNKAHKIGKKVILPVNGMFGDPYWHKGPFELRNAEATIMDIEKVFEYLDGHMSAHVDLHGVLQQAYDEGRTKGIHCKFFSVTLYKKGTMHITFHDQRLVDRFNIYCGQHKSWLPPSYGRAAYTDMEARDKAVVDSFHGDGSRGSGESAYQAILARKDYYLGEPAKTVQALMPGV